MCLWRDLIKFVIGRVCCCFIVTDGHFVSMRLQRDNLEHFFRGLFVYFGQLEQSFDFPSLFRPAAITSTLTNYSTRTFWITCTSFEEFATCLLLTLPKFVTRHSSTLCCLHRFKIRGVQSPKITFWTYSGPKWAIATLVFPGEKPLSRTEHFWWVRTNHSDLGTFPVKSEQPFQGQNWMFLGEDVLTEMFSHI